MKLKLFFTTLCMLVLTACKSQNTPDLAYYQLKGAVKTLMQGNDTIQFDANGTITSVNGKDLFALENPYREMNEEEGSFIDIAKWTRNEQGQIAKIALLESEDEITWENGKVAYVTGEGEGMNYKISYTYDEDGNLIELTEAFWGNYDGAADEAEVYKTTFRILEKDASGNWIKRERTSSDYTSEETRTIIYY